MAHVVDYFVAYLMKILPSIGDTIKTPNGEGKVVSIDILNFNCKVLVGEEIVEVKINDEKDA